jgi:hypothetical protein
MNELIYHNAAVAEYSIQVKIGINSVPKVFTRIDIAVAVGTESDAAILGSVEHPFMGVRLSKVEPKELNVDEQYRWGEGGDKVPCILIAGNLDKVIQAVSCCTYFVGVRCHSIHFSVSRHVPTVVLPYAEKCVDLAMEFGPRDSVIERERMVDACHIESRLDGLVSNPDKHTSDIERILQIQKSLEGIPSVLIFRESWRMDERTRTCESW